MEFTKGLTFLWFCVLILLFSVTEGKRTDASLKIGSVYCKNRKCRFTAKLDWQSATVVGTFNDTLLATGWGVFDLSVGHGTSGTFSNDDIMFGAGFLEGMLTAHQMDNHYTNIKARLFVQAQFKDLDVWFSKQRAWSDMMVRRHGKGDPHWRMMGYILAQLDGLYTGYKMVRPGKNATLDMFAINFLNAVGDVADIYSALSPTTLADWTKFSPDEARRFASARGHCSALIKLTPGSDLFMAHSTWFLYTSTNRIYKHYDLHLNDQQVFGKRMSFSSYPGTLASIDDFYLLSSGLVMLQTSISVYESSLYHLVRPQSLLAWQRVRLANMAARNGREWTEVFMKHNSGTYNNEYMVVDMNRFQPNKTLPDGTLWLADQIPGLVMTADVTHVLRKGYFPSYNIPYFEEIFNKSGNSNYAKIHGEKFSYNMDPRARIFRRDAGKVSSLDDLKALMRYNDYKKDAYSDGSPIESICARGDIENEYAAPDGCYDTKVADVTMARALQADVINGPTRSHGLPPFKWVSPFTDFSHVGLPPVYNFSFEKTKPRFKTRN